MHTKEILTVILNIKDKKKPTLPSPSLRLSTLAQIIHSLCCDDQEDNKVRLLLISVTQAARLL